MSANATYALISETGKDFSLFLGNGTLISAKGFTIGSKTKTSAAFETEGDKLSFTSEAPVKLSVPDIYTSGKIILTAVDIKIIGKRLKVGTQKIVEFDLPTISYQPIKINTEK